MEEVTSAKRLSYMDVAKGMAILCVIAGHLGINTVMRLVYPFHIPIFFLISGYFLSTRKEYKDFVQEKAGRLLVPYLAACAGVCILVVPADLVRGMKDQVLPDLIRWGLASVYGAGADYKIPFQIKEIGAVWFLPALFWALITVRYFLGTKYCAVMIGIIAGVSWLTSRYIWLPFSLQAGGVAAVFVYTGYLARKHRLLDHIPDIRFFLLGMLLLLLAYRRESVMVAAANDYPAGIFDMVSSVLISYSVICIAYMISCKTCILKSALCFCGRNSLIILCFHLLELSMFPWNYVLDFLQAAEIPSSLQMGLLFTGKAAFSTIGAVLSLKVPFLKKIIT